jgi:hypothetical protein
VDLTVSGGTEPYQYNWSNGPSTEDQLNVLAGVYQVTVRDASGCELMAEYTVNEPAEALSASGTVSDVDCKGESNGSILLNVSGGAAPYQFSWSNGSSTQDQSNLMAGSYQVTVTDANGCSYAAEFVVNEPAEVLSATAMVTKPSCSGEADGQIIISVFGGTAPYQFSWSNGAISRDLTNLKPGFYQVSITDANGCITTWSGDVQAKSKAVLSGYARHSNGYVNAEDADVRLYDAYGHGNHPVAEARIGTDGSFSFTDVPDGEYILYVKLDNHAKQKYKGVMHSYYGQTYKWKEARHINLSCEDSEVLVVDMFENPAYTSGEGKAGGKVSKIDSKKKSAPLPVLDAQVLLIDETSDLPVDYIQTDDNGTYVFTDIGLGDYSLYVDIPGITHKTTHSFSVTEEDLVHMDLDFEVDEVWEMVINSVLNTSIPDALRALNDISIYPNPTISDYIILQSEFLYGQKVEIIIFSDLGSLMQQRDMYVAGDQIKLDLFGYKPGNYILRIKIDQEVQYKKIIVLNH